MDLERGGGGEGPGIGRDMVGGEGELKMGCVWWLWMSFLKGFGEMVVGCLRSGRCLGFILREDGEGF